MTAVSRDPTAPAAGEAEKNAARTMKKIWTSAVLWSSLRACVFLAAAIVFFVIGYRLSRAASRSFNRSSRR